MPRPISLFLIARKLVNFRVLSNEHSLWPNKHSMTLPALKIPLTGDRAIVLARRFIQLDPDPIPTFSAFTLNAKLGRAHESDGTTSFAGFIKLTPCANDMLQASFVDGFGRGGWSETANVPCLELRQYRVLPLFVFFLRQFEFVDERCVDEFAASSVRVRVVNLPTRAHELPKYKLRTSDPP